MKLKITVADLQSKRACRSGIDAFSKQFGQVAKIEWTRESQIELLKTPMRKYLGWAHYVGLLPLWTLSSVDTEFCGPEFCGPAFCGPAFCEPEFCGPEFCGHFGGSIHRF